MSLIHLDIIDNNIPNRNVDVSDITQFLPLPDGGCVVGLKSIGVVKVRQTVEEISQKILNAVRTEGII